MGCSLPFSSRMGCLVTLSLRTHSIIDGRQMGIDRRLQRMPQSKLYFGAEERWAVPRMTWLIAIR